MGEVEYRPPLPPHILYHIPQHIFTTMRLSIILLLLGLLALVAADGGHHRTRSGRQHQLRSARNRGRFPSRSSRPSARGGRAFRGRRGCQEAADAYAAPADDAYGAPADDAYGAPAADAYGAPADEEYSYEDDYGAYDDAAAADAYAAPADDAYGAPADDAHGAPAGDEYSYDDEYAYDDEAAADAYAAPADDAYGAPADDAYGAPAGDEYDDAAADDSYAAPGDAPVYEAGREARGRFSSRGR